MWRFGLDDEAGDAADAEDVVGALAEDVYLERNFVGVAYIPAQGLEQRVNEAVADLALVHLPSLTIRQCPKAGHQLGYLLSSFVHVHS